jgi:hypothetical protein
VRASTEHQPVLALVLSVGLGPSLGCELVGATVCRVGLGVVERKPGRRDEHGALGSGVSGSDGVVLLDEVGNHDHGRAVAEGLLDRCASVFQFVNVIDVDGAVFSVAVTHHSLAFVTDLLENLRTVGNELEQPAGSRASGVLGSEEEGEDSHGDLNVGELAQDVLGLLLGGDGLAAGDSLPIALAVHHFRNPPVHNALGLGTRLSHANLGLCGARSESLENLVGSLLAVPSLGEGNDDGEVYEFECSGNVVVVVGNLLDLSVGHVVTDESAASHSACELTEVVNELGTALVRANAALLLSGVLGNLVESLKVFLVDLLLSGHVCGQSLAGEETVQTLAVLDVCLSIQEDPVLSAEELDGDVDDAGLDVGRGVENLAGHVAGRGDDDELVEDADTAQGSGQPFGVVCLELGPDGLEEGTDEGDLPGGADERALLTPVRELVVDYCGGKQRYYNAECAGVLGDRAQETGVDGADGGLNGRGRDDAGGGVEGVHDGCHGCGGAVCVYGFSCVVRLCDVGEHETPFSGSQLKARRPSSFHNKLLLIYPATVDTNVAKGRNGRKSNCNHATRL